MRRASMDPKELERLFQQVKKPRRPACRHGHTVSVENMGVAAARKGQYICAGCWGVNHAKYLANKEKGNVQEHR